MDKNNSVRSELYEALFNGNGIARRLMYAVILFSSAFTLIFTAIQLYLGYSSDLELIKKNFHIIEVSQVPSISNSLWSGDEQQIQIQLDGLLQLPDIEHASVTLNGVVKWNSGAASAKRTLTRLFTLEYVHKGQTLTIGELETVASLDNVRDRVWDRLIEILISNAIKTFFVSTFILLIFQLLVTRHLYKIANYAEGIEITDSNTPDLDLGRNTDSNSRTDALERVAGAINAMRHRLAKSMEELQEKEENLNSALVDAERANQSKSEFLASMSHELRTPLNAILGFSDVLSGQYFGPPGAGKYREYAEDIHRSGEHLLELINDVLDISSIEAGKTPLNRELLTIEDVIEDCKRTIAEKAASKGIEVEVSGAVSEHPVYADKRAIKQILLNLLSNAIKFTPNSGKITVTTAVTEGTTSIVVSDNGVGISPDKLPYVASPFAKGVTDPHVSEQGWGLGLAISNSLVELHGGVMTIESEIGKGTSVTIEISSHSSDAD